MRLKRSWLRARSSWMRAAMSCGMRARWSRSRRGRSCSRLHARWVKPGQQTCRGSTLVARAFRGKHADESHRARLRVEVGRLRVELRALADVSATKRGFALEPRRARKVVVLAPPVEEQHAAVLALLADGESWSSSALAIALGASPRTVQRALELACGGRQGAVVRSRASASLDDPDPCRDSRRSLLLPAVQLTECS